MHALLLHALVAFIPSYERTWSYFFGQLVAGLTLGSLYALLALGYTLVYGILKLLNFAHGDVYMIGSYIGYFVLTALGGSASPVVPIGCPAPGDVRRRDARLGSARGRDRALRLPAAPPRAADRTADQRARCLVLPAADCRPALRLDPEELRHLQPARRGALQHITIGSFRIQYVQLLVIVSAVVLMVALSLLVSYTQVGRAMRATSFDLEAATMMGVNVDTVIVFTFFVGSALAGAAGVMNGLVYQNVTPYIGFEAGLKAFTAAVVGGIGNIRGAMLGGIMIGLAQTLTAGFLSSTFQDLIVFAILIVFMLVRPTGLLGTAAIQKV